MTNTLILGANSAIAQATARILADRGGTLFLVGRNAEKLTSFGNDLEDKHPGRIHTLQADLVNTEDHPALLEDIRSRMDPIDLVLMAHGELGDQEKAETDWVETERLLRVNFLSAVSLLTLLAPGFEQRGKGTLAVISSVAGDRGRKSNYIYGTSKGALSLFLQGLRARLHGSGVQVLTIKPGFVATPMTAHLKQGPLFAKPETIARGIVRAVDRRRDQVYLPFWWRPIMWIVRALPEPIFKRLSY
jgi:short-subunit dehydrogenase